MTGRVSCSNSCDDVLIVFWRILTWNQCKHDIFNVWHCRLHWFLWIWWQLHVSNRSAQRQQKTRKVAAQTRNISSPSLSVNERNQGCVPGALLQPEDTLHPRHAGYSLFSIAGYDIFKNRHWIQTFQVSVMELSGWTLLLRAYTVTLRGGATVSQPVCCSGPKEVSSVKCLATKTPSHRCTGEPWQTRITVSHVSTHQVCLDWCNNNHLKLDIKRTEELMMDQVSAKTWMLSPAAQKIYTISSALLFLNDAVE